MSGVKIKDVDKGYSKLVKAVFQDKKAHVTVGIHEAEGAQNDGSGDVTILQVAIWNEFGTATIPERSFIRAYLDENDQKIRGWLKALMPSVLKGERTKAQILELIGTKMVAEIQARIAAGISPPNAPSTIARKGSSTPLIDTGALRSAITFKVEGIE